MDHSSMNHDQGMKMDHGMSHPPMWYHTSIGDAVIFSWWRVNDLPTLLLSCFLLAGCGFALEWLRTVRARLKAGRRCSGKQLEAARHGSLHGGDTVGYYATFSVAERETSKRERSLFADCAQKFHVIDTALFGLQTALSYTVMLVFMTYSVPLCTSLVAGTATGYWVWGRERRMM